MKVGLPKTLQALLEKKLFLKLLRSLAKNPLSPHTEILMQRLGR